MEINYGTGCLNIRDMDAYFPCTKDKLRRILKLILVCENCDSLAVELHKYLDSRCNTAKATADDLNQQYQEAELRRSKAESWLETNDNVSSYPKPDPEDVANYRSDLKTYTKVTKDLAADYKRAKRTLDQLSGLMKELKLWCDKHGVAGE